jgi:hypothetical protein
MITLCEVLFLVTCILGGYLFVFAFVSYILYRKLCRFRIVRMQDELDIAQTTKLLTSETQRLQDLNRITHPFIHMQPVQNVIPRSK